MIRRALGRTGIQVSALGFGGGPLGDARLEDRDAERLVHHALDLGIDLFDTAPSYGASERRLATALRGVRHRATLVTKAGYGVPGERDWSPRCIELGVDRACRALSTDVIDVVLLHSCPLDVLSRGDLIEPLVLARQAGKIRAIGYSGDGAPLAWAVGCEAFDVVECSVNVVDQEAMADAVPRARARSVGILAKRGVACAPWAAAAPARDDAKVYRRRFDAMAAHRDARRFADRWQDVAVRFSAFAPGVTSVLIGTTRASHLEAAAHSVMRGDVDDQERAAIARAFSESGGGEGIV